eukprot:jgi/Mesvir1/24890/Mv22113-RA.1
MVEAMTRACSALLPLLLLVSLAQVQAQLTVDWVYDADANSPPGYGRQKIDTGLNDRPFVFLNTTDPVTFEWVASVGSPNWLCQHLVKKTGFVNVDVTTGDLTDTLPTDTSLSGYGFDWTPCNSGRKTLKSISLVDGYHTFSVRTVPFAGGVNRQVNWEFKIDTKGPNSTITTDVPDLVFEDYSSLSFSFTGLDLYGNLARMDPYESRSDRKNPAYSNYLVTADLSTCTDACETSFLTFLCKFDNDRYEPCTSPVTTSTLSVGPHSFFVKAVDAAGNNESDASVVTFTIEPYTASTGCTFQYSVNGSSWAPLAAGVVTKNLTAIPGNDYPYSFSIKATDVYGNVGEQNTFSWYIDRTAPTLEITTAVVLGDATTDGNFTFTADGLVDQFKIYKSWVGPLGAFVAPTACASTYCNWTETWAAGVYAPNVDNPDTSVPNVYAINATAYDAVGNAAQLLSVTWRVDPIETSVVAVNTSAQNRTFSVLASRDAYLAASDFIYEYILDNSNGGKWTRRDPTQHPTIVAKFSDDLPDQWHNLTVRVAGRDNNAWDPTPSITLWYQDTTPPVTTITAMPGAMSSDPAASFTFIANEPGTYYYSLDDAVEISTGAINTVTLANLTEGVHVFRVRTKDVAGNEGAYDSYRWIVDFGPPETSVYTGPPTPTPETTNLFVFGSSEADSTFEYKVDGVGGWTQLEAGVDSVVISDAGEGIHTLRVRATDAARNVDPTPAAYTWTVLGADGLWGKYCASCSYRVGGSPPSQYTPPDADTVQLARRD